MCLDKFSYMHSLPVGGDQESRLVSFRLPIENGLHICLWMHNMLFLLGMELVLIDLHPNALHLLVLNNNYAVVLPLTIFAPPNYGICWSYMRDGWLRR